MAAQPTPFFTPEEYLELEREAEFKSEYLAGQIFAMAGASRPHNVITFNISSELRTQLKGRACEGYAADMRVRTGPGGLYTYPDVVVVCGEPRCHDSHMDTLTNPTVIIEILSDSTEAFDRGEKFALYRRIESLKEYILVSQSKPRVERFHRQENGEWLLAVADGMDAKVSLPSIDCGLALAEVYDKVEFPDTAPSSTTAPDA